MTVLVDLTCDVAGLLEGDDSGIVAVVEVLAGVPVCVKSGDVEINQRGSVAGGGTVPRGVGRIRT